MTVPTTSPPPIITAIEIALWIVGLIVLWRVQFNQDTRGKSPVRLAPWELSLTAIFSMSLCVVTGGWFAQYIVSNLSNQTLGAAAHDVKLWELVQGTAFQLGLLAGVLASACLARLEKPKPAIQDETVPAPCLSPFLAGVGTFLVALSVLPIVGYAWKQGLEALGLDVSEQDAVEIFRQADSPAKLIVFVGLAVIVAPLTEELIFRAGLFRYLRTRVPRWIALLAPAALFAVLHSNLVAFIPLLLLGILFSLAYERTGRISVTIIAHGLFNLHTILLIMAGVTS